MKKRSKTRYIIPDSGDEEINWQKGELVNMQLKPFVMSGDDIIGNYAGRSSGSKSVVIVGDMHVGHYYALGTPLKKLRAVNDFWYSARDKLKKERSNIFVINGEPIDGDQPRQLGGELWTSDMGEQMQVANKLISHYKMDSIGITRGSNYHSTRGNTNFESILGSYLTCAPVLDYSPYGKKAYNVKHGYERIRERDPVGHRPYTRIEDILQISLNGHTFNIIHHTGVTSNFATAPSSIATQILKNLIATGKLWKKPPTFTVRSHSHHFVLVQYGNTVGWVNPAWQIFSMYTLQKSMSAASIGLVEVIIESNGEYIINKIIMPDKDYPKIDVIDIK